VVPKACEAMKTHVPDFERPDWSLCGRYRPTFIRPGDCVEDATCKNCGRVDDSRSAKTYRAEMIAAGRGDEL
jgi:hypothetical protein